MACETSSTVQPNKCICVVPDCGPCDCGAPVGGPGFSSFGHHLHYAPNIYATQSDPLLAKTSYDFGAGYNWLNSAWPYVTDLDVGPTNRPVVVVMPPGTPLWFDVVGDAYAARQGKHKLTYAANGFILTSPDGGRWTFLGFAPGTVAKGRFASYTSPGGLTTTVTGYTETGHILGISTTYTTAEGNTVAESYEYSYSDDNGHERLQYATLRRTVGGKASDRRRICYDYRDGSLRMAGFQTPDGDTWQDGDTYVYGHYTGGEPGGTEHGLKYVLDPQACRDLAAAGHNPLTISDATAKTYADRYFEYDGEGRISKLITGGGAQETSYTYVESGFDDDRNHWKKKTTETRPDGTQLVTHKNYMNQVMLTDRIAGGEHAIEYRQYDAAGNLTLHATASAVDSYNDASANLAVQYKSDGGVQNVGLIHVYEYYPTTDLPNGAVEGYKACDKIQRGGAGTPIKLREYAYTEHTFTSDGHTVTIYPIARETVYANTNGTGAIETSYDYLWHADTAQMLERTTTLPGVAVQQNGSGASATRTERFDLYGNLVWLKDERGYITYHEYDLVTGALIRTIEDVDDSRIITPADCSIAELPDGWATPAGGGLHLATDYEIDDQGRTVQALGPPHEVNGQTVRTASWTVYKDADHEVWSASGYATGTGPQYSYTLVNPVSITKSDASGRTLETIRAVRGSTQGRLCPSNEFPQSSYVSWTVNSYDVQGRLRHTRVFHDIPDPCTHATTDHYDQTEYDYDAAGRQHKVTSPGGTITRSVFNAQGQQAATYVGTDDTGATDADPTGGGAAGNNMVLVSESIYDTGVDCGGCGGCSTCGSGKLTSSIQHVDAETVRTTSFRYDWRGRQEYVIPDLDDQGRQTYTKNYYDNLDRPIMVERHHDADGDGHYPEDGTVDPDDVLLAREETFYDDRGQVYRTRTHAVDPSDGTVGAYLEGNTWYDAAGNAVKQQSAGARSFTKSTYDGLGRAVRQYTGYDDAETTYAEVLTVEGDTILQQQEAVYNEAGSVVFSTTWRRMDDATGTGALSAPDGEQPIARVSYTAAWYDEVGRTTATADYGTGGGVSPVRPAAAPPRSDTVLVSETRYNDRGEAFATIDPAGVESRTESDAAGRQIRAIQNYQADSDAEDKNVTVEMAYNADGNLRTLTAKNPTTGDQVTRYVYGSHLGVDSPLICRTDLLRAEIYPDSDDTPDLGDGADGVFDRVEYEYNRQGETIRKKDQNGTVHRYEFDPLGRQVCDRVTELGEGVDGAVRRIERTFEVRGLPETITSFYSPTSGGIVNQVKMEYNSFGQLISDYQEHAAVVSVGTSPKVGYGYADGSAGHVRPTRVTYPNGRVLRYEYHAGTDDAFNRPSFLADDHAGQLGWRLAEYAYLGLGQVIEMHHEEPDLLFTLAHGMEADPYDGLDRFDRTVDMRWTCCMGGYSGSGSSGDPGDCEAELVEQVCYGYDRASNRTHRRMPIAAAWGTNLDELYGYDRLHRLVDFDRGKLIRDDDLIDPLARKAQWTLDATGNWSRFRRFDQHDADAALDQTRGHNGANEVTDIAETVGRVWISPTHDRAGNMLILPRPSDPRESYIATYDAWHRLVKLTQSDGAGGLEPVAEYAYDGRNFRTVKQTYAAGELIAARHSYYSSQWQVLEERLDDSPAAACQYVWGERYIDDLVLRDRDTAGDGLLDERFYALQDANWNVIAISDPYCQIQERYAYDAYGTPAVHNAAFTPIATSAYAWPYTYTGRRLDEESALMYYRNRMYHAELGRFVSRDPVGMVQNAALYAYAHGSPLGKTDSLGLWGSDVHRGRTFDLAAQAGYPMNAARTIGDWNEDVDWFATSWGPGWAPIVGKQSYHFNRNLSAGGGADTRIMHKVKHFIEATKTCSEKNDPDEAAKHLGVALHPLQDFYAHGDYGINDTIPNGGNWIVHNQYSPQSPLPGKPNLASYPDDPALDAVGGPGGRPAGPAMRERTFEWAGPNFVADYAIYRRGTQRIRDTEAATSELLVDFRRFLERLPDGRGCNCRQFFGVR